MPALKNQRWEIFAQELAKGKTSDEAYQAAGYAENSGNAARLKGNERILARMNEIQSKAAKRVEVTVESLISECEEVQNLAIQAGQLNAAMAAIKEKGVLSGKRIERSERGQPNEFDFLNGMNADELRSFFIEQAQADGLLPENDTDSRRTRAPGEQLN